MVVAYAELAQLIAQRVEANVYPSGSRLPSERQLAEEFQVSRPTVREALAALQIMGVVETHRGAGTFVRPGSLQDAGQRREPRWGSDASPFELLETRLLIEPRITRLASQRWHRQSLAAIARPLKKLEDSAAAGSGKYDAELDRQFHAAIAGAVGNSVLAEIVAPLWDLMSQALWHALSQQDWSHANTAREASDHRAIFEAIRDRDAETAGFLMELHLRNVLAYLFESEPLGKEDGPGG
jgi:DNA-binding FadR family transcriptional regulator